MFVINDKVLPASANKLEIKNALYLAIYMEFSGASKNKKYVNLTNAQKIEAVNQFAAEWLIKGNYK